MSSITQDPIAEAPLHPCCGPATDHTRPQLMTCSRVSTDTCTLGHQGGDDAGTGRDGTGGCCHPSIRTELRGCFVRVDGGHIVGEDIEHIMIGGGWRLSEGCLVHSFLSGPSHDDGRCSEGIQ